MINTQDITVGNTTSKLIKYRSFVYKGEKYTVFIEPTTETEDSPGEIRMLAPLSDGTYTLPPADICRLLYPLCVDMILYQMHFDPALSGYPDVILLPWNEEQKHGDTCEQNIKFPRLR